MSIAATAPRLIQRIAWRAYGEAAAIIAVATVLSEIFRGVLSPANIALIFMTGTFIAGIRRGFWPAICASLLSIAAMSFFHAVPRFSFGVSRPDDMVTLICFLLASFLTGDLVSRFRKQLEETQATAARNERLFEASRRLAGTFQRDDLLRTARDVIAAALDAETLLLEPAADGRLEPALPPRADFTTADAAIAQWSFEQRDVAGRDTDAHAHSAWYFLPLNGERETLGVLGVCRRDDAPPLDAEQQRLLFALRDLAAVALDRRRLADEMRTTQVLAEGERLRAALLSSVSHDLRTPLATIIGAASTLHELGDSIAPAGQRELVAAVLSEAQRLNRFVGNLLDMTRLEYGGLKPQPSWCDIRDLVAEVTQRIGERNYRVRVAEDFPVLYTDAVLLEHVLENLVDNAAKYAGPGSPIALAADKVAERAVITVTDEGPGIPPGERDAVFTLFHRVKDADARAAGTGLGLTICKGIVEALGGDIRIDDNPAGRGTRIVITLPVAGETLA